jgi:hypothetical protein
MGQQEIEDYTSSFEYTRSKRVSYRGTPLYSTGKSSHFLDGIFGDARAQRHLP